MSVASVDAWLVDALAPRPGHAIVEVGAGAGDAGLELASRVAPSGWVLRLDADVDAARAGTERAASLGLRNVECAAMDFDDIDLADGIADAAACRWVLDLGAEPARVVAEAARIVHDDGRVGLTAWGDPWRNALAALVADELVRRGAAAAPQADRAERGPDDLAALLTGAGLEVERAEEVAFHERFATFAEYWTRVTEARGPTARTLAALPDDERTAVRRAVADRASAYAEDDALIFPALALGAVGVKRG